MKTMRPFLAIAVLFAVGCHTWRAPSPDSPSHVSPSPRPVVSLIRIVADPDRFSGQEVGVVGFLRIKDDSALLFVDEDDARNGLLVNAIRVSLPPAMLSRSGEFTSRYVTVRGLFVSSPDRIAGRTAGALSGVTGCMTEGVGPTVTYPSLPVPPDGDPFAPGATP